MPNFLDPKRQFTLEAGREGWDFLHKEVIAKHLTRGHMDLFRIMQEMGIEPALPLDFQGIDNTILYHMNLRFVPLSGKQFSEEQLPVLFEKARNGEVVLEGLDLRGKYVTESHGITFLSCITDSGTVFDGGVRECIFEQCDLSEARFQQADLTQTVFEKGCKLPPARNFSDVKIGGDTFPDTKVGQALNRALQERSGGLER